MDKYDRPSVTVDMTVFTLDSTSLKVLLIKRDLAPFKGKWALPGGFVKIKESLEDAAKRKLEEKTGVKDVYLEQLYTFGDPNRDPRERVITVAYLALIKKDVVSLKASTDISEAKWFDINDLPELAFDHQTILKYALQRLKWKFEYTSVAFSLLSNNFTMGELQKIYETIFNKKFDKRNFNKKILSLDILKEEGLKKEVSYRPPMLYSLKSNIPKIIEILHPQD